MVNEFISQTGHELIACCFHFLLCGMQGVQHVVESRGIVVNVHLPSVALKAFVGGSHGHCRVAISSSPLAVYCEHVQMGESLLGSVRDFME